MNLSSPLLYRRVLPRSILEINHLGMLGRRRNAPGARAKGRRVMRSMARPQGWVWRKKEGKLHRGKCLFILNLLPYCADDNIRKVSSHFDYKTFCPFPRSWGMTQCVMGKTIVTIKTIERAEKLVFVRCSLLFTPWLFLRVDKPHQRGLYSSINTPVIIITKHTNASFINSRHHDIHDPLQVHSSHQKMNCRL